MAKPTTVTAETTIKNGEVTSLKTALGRLGLKVGDLDKEVKKDVMRGDLVRKLIEICRKAEKKK